MSQNNKYKFTILGGDKRTTALVRYLYLCGQNIGVCMLGDSMRSLGGVTFYSSYEKAVSNCDILVLPMPITRDNQNIFVADQASSNKISIEDVFMRAKNSRVKYVLGGNTSKEIRGLAKRIGIDLIDYSLSEEFLQNNAYATAEGGVMIAMENIDTTLKGSNVIVSGYGRIARHIARMLHNFGCNVTVIARRDEALREAAAEDYSTINIASTDEVRKSISDCQIIFNTIPSGVFSSRHIGDECGAVYIELASCPGGIDLKAARDAGMKIIFAPSLPGRYSPESAGGYIFDSIKDNLAERGVYI